ncbi:hypothetical protein IL306_000598 [Fusarium sp. DS 682]|nr:hypothetical protein IL306_000598 [Fusarium sp. DS 682]
MSTSKTSKRPATSVPPSAPAGKKRGRPKKNPDHVENENARANAADGEGSITGSNENDYSQEDEALVSNRGLSPTLSTLLDSLRPFSSGRSSLDQVQNVQEGTSDTDNAMEQRVKYLEAKMFAMQREHDLLRSSHDRLRRDHNRLLKKVVENEESSR